MKFLRTCDIFCSSVKRGRRCSAGSKTRFRELSARSGLSIPRRAPDRSAMSDGNGHSRHSAADGHHLHRNQRDRHLSALRQASAATCTSPGFQLDVHALSSKIASSVQPGEPTASSPFVAGNWEIFPSRIASSCPWSVAAGERLLPSTRLLFK